MHEGALSVLTAWSNFYVIAGSSAAALTGLMFVVITLVAGDRERATSTSMEGIDTFSTPTVVHFSAALLLAGVMSVPWRSLAPAAVLLAIIGLYGFAYELRVMQKTRNQSVYEPGIDDWFWYAILPLVAYAAIVGGASGLVFAPVGALFAPAAGVLLLIFIGIRNAWDVVTYLAVVEPDRRDPRA